jgi:activator of HSP90 ATPase
MANANPTRRDFPLWLATLSATLGAAATAGADEETPGLSRSAEEIHQSVRFDAARSRVYAALTIADQFDAVSKLGVAARGGKLPSAPTQIAADPGGSFALFGGYIIGRQLELVADTRLVQAWREKSWEPGTFSIVKFELSDDGTGTKLAFAHTGFPPGAGKHLSIGWYENYWDPMKKYLSPAGARG